MFLAVIKPPNNSETALMEMKRRLYRETGFVQVWALKPFIPLGLFSRTPPEMSRAVLPPIPESGLLINELTETRGHILLSSPGCRDFCDNVLNTLELDFESDSGFRGLHLYDSRGINLSERGSLNERTGELLAGQKVSVLNWKSFSLEIYRTEPGLFVLEDWWKRVVFESVLEISFPKGRRR